MSSRVRSSWSGFTNENRYETPIAPMSPTSRRRSTSRRTASSSSCHEHRPVPQHPLGDADAPRARHEVPRLAPVQVEVVRPRDALDAQDVAEAVRRQQRHVGAAALDQGVRGDGRAVHEVRDVRRLEPGLREGVEDRARRLARRRRHLGHADVAALLVVQHEVREGAARVDSSPDAHRASLGRCRTIVLSTIRESTGGYAGSRCAPGSGLSEAGPERRRPKALRCATGRARPHSSEPGGPASGRTRRSASGYQPSQCTTSSNGRRAAGLKSVPSV